ncbi:thioredoxin domain-containing protein [Candidatus Enterovibrio altilux]|nr:hypothetical protein [Candidatus Enterovibrio luxaltus]
MTGMNKAKKDNYNKNSDQCTNLILRHMTLSDSMSVTGTPTMLL